MYLREAFTLLVDYSHNMDHRQMICIKFDKSKPDGMPKKCLDITLAKKYGWRYKTNLDKGFEITYKDFQKNN